MSLLRPGAIECFNSRPRTASDVAAARGATEMQFQLTPAHGERHGRQELPHSYQVSTHARARRATVTQTVSAHWGCFNSRPRTASDLSKRSNLHYIQSFNSRPRTASDDSSDVHCVSCAVSTHARARRATCSIPTDVDVTIVSTHARARRATSSGHRAHRVPAFQLTPAHGERLQGTMKA